MFQFFHFCITNGPWIVADTESSNHVTLLFMLEKICKYPLQNNRNMAHNKYTSLDIITVGF